MDTQTAHNGEVFDTGIMSQAESMPQYQVGIFDLQAGTIVSVKSYQ